MPVTAATRTLPWMVSVDPKDLGNDVFSGVRFQQMLEQQAFFSGGGTFVAPMQTAEAFLKGKAEIELDRVQPTYSLGGIPYDFAAAISRQSYVYVESWASGFWQKTSWIFQS